MAASAPAVAAVFETSPGLSVALAGYFPGLDISTAAVDEMLVQHLLTERLFRKIFDLTAPGGSVWITDLVAHEMSGVQDLMWERYGAYLESQGGEEYRRKVFDYIDREDSPRPVTYQLELLRRVGFSEVDLLHQNSCFAAFGGKKGHPLGRP